jgi:hypothetical protein
MPIVISTPPLVSIPTLVTSVLLSFQWLFLLLGLLRCCGYTVKPPKRHASKFTNAELPILEMTNPLQSSLTKLRPCYAGTKSKIALTLFFATSMAMIASCNLFMRKSLVFNGEDFGLCVLSCKTALIFYGIAKIVIYWQLYIKIEPFVNVEDNPRMSRFILVTTTALSLIGFAIAIILAVSNNLPAVNGGSCTCKAPISAPIAMLVCDWIVSITLLVYFSRHVVKQLSVPDNPTRELWKSVALEQFIVAIFMLMITPVLMGIFIYLQPLPSPPVPPGTFLMIDLVISCYAQGFSSRKMWGTDSRYCICFRLQREGILDTRNLPPVEEDRPASEYPLLLADGEQAKTHKTPKKGMHASLSTPSNSASQDAKVEFSQGVPKLAEASAASLLSLLNTQ